ncbi:MAG: GNAT family N-acetyltransferase [Pseudomonadota bacterium]
MISIVQTLPENYRMEAASLYDDAFGPKLAVAIANPDTRRSLIAESLNLRFAFAAIANDNLVGIAGYRTEEGSLTEGLSFDALKRSLGLIKGTRAALLLSFYERGLKPKELLMDGIAVHCSMRGKGVGTQLLQALCNYAKGHHYHQIRLDVIDTNPRARQLYERNGFEATHTENFGYLRWFFGFGASTTLIRRL